MPIMQQSQLCHTSWFPSVRVFSFTLTYFSCIFAHPSKANPHIFGLFQPHPPWSQDYSPRDPYEWATLCSVLKIARGLSIIGNGANTGVESPPRRPSPVPPTPHIHTPCPQNKATLVPERPSRKARSPRRPLKRTHSAACWVPPLKGTF